MLKKSSVLKPQIWVLDPWRIRHRPYLRAKAATTFSAS